MTQRTHIQERRLLCCELLSNLYLCIGWHSNVAYAIAIKFVVNCFQICIFVSDDTAKMTYERIWSMLWIAFKFVSLYRMTQLIKNIVILSIGCELLSNLYLCIGWHSKTLQAKRGAIVVNCFQICIFVSDDTAFCLTNCIIDQLWIAFKFVSLYRMTQPGGAEPLPFVRCELLSNLYLCIGWHSCLTYLLNYTIVVNCFQICIFVSDDTADQPVPYSKARCELLSNLYLCIGWHSRQSTTTSS